MVFFIFIFSPFFSLSTFRSESADRDGSSGSVGSGIYTADLVAREVSPDDTESVTECSFLVGPFSEYCILIGTFSFCS